MSVVIEPAAARHLPEILRIEREAFRDPWSEQSLQYCIADSGILFSVAAKGERLLGFAVLQLIPPEAELQNIAVSPEAKRQGIGRLLLSQLITQCEAGGIEAIHLEVRASNYPAIALYQALGFEAVGCRRAYYTNPQEDALLMTRMQKGDLP